jgi:hypothetical protein
MSEAEEHEADIPRRTEIEISQFADNNAAFTSNKNVSYAVSNLQRYISDLEPCLYKWKIKLTQIRLN